MWQGDCTTHRHDANSVSAPAIPNTVHSVDLQYNALGLLLSKSDVGNYSYNAQGGGAGSQPHALQSVSGAMNSIFGFDANGNVTTATGGKYRSVSYTSFNLPDAGNGLQGPAGSPKYTWLYDESHARIKETRLDSSGTRVTWYMHPDNAGGLGFEAEVAPNGAVSLRHYLNAGDVGIVHMNGRLFDPTLGVFMQPDAHVQNATDLQNFNRYGYCLNNPSLLVKRRLGASESCWCMLRHHQRPDPISS